MFGCLVGWIGFVEWFHSNQKWKVNLGQFHTRKKEGQWMDYIDGNVWMNEHETIGLIFKTTWSFFFTCFSVFYLLFYLLYSHFVKVKRDKIDWQIDGIVNDQLEIDESKNWKQLTFWQSFQYYFSFLTLSTLTIV